MRLDAVLDADRRETISIAAGTLDAPTGLRTTLQIHVASAGDYYDVDASIRSVPSEQSEAQSPHAAAARVWRPLQGAGWWTAEADASSMRPARDVRAAPYVVGFYLVPDFR